jgi:hypothetical protein
VGAGVAVSVAFRPAAAVAISATGVLITGLCLVTADRLNASAPARTLAVLAVAFGMTATLGALAGSGLPRWRTVAGAALAAGVAVVLATVAALIVVLAPPTDERPDEPVMTLSLTGGAGETKVSVLLQFPDLPSRGLVEARLTGITFDAMEADLGRAVATAGRDGYAEVRLETTDTGQFRNLRVEATMTGRKCTVGVPLEDGISPDKKLECR